MPEGVVINTVVKFCDTSVIGETGLLCKVSKVDKLNQWFTTQRSNNANLQYMNLAIIGRNDVSLSHTFSKDFYYRIYINPEVLDFKAVTGEVIEDVGIWNAWVDRSTIMTNVVVENDEGITIEPGAPLVLKPMQFGIVKAKAGTKGPAIIDTRIFFTFNTEAGDIVIKAMGNRVNKFAIPAEVPVNETWSWLTETIKGVDGSEQTINLTGNVNRTMLEYRVVLVDQGEVDLFNSALLAGGGKIFLPEWQYSTVVSNAVDASSTNLIFDKSLVDVRVGEFALLFTDTTDALVQIKDLTADGVTLTQPLGVEFDKQPSIVSGGTAIIGNSSVSRHAVDYAGSVNLAGSLQRYRSENKRPQSINEFDMYQNRLVLDKQPLANTMIDDVFVQDLQLLDNKVGIIDAVQHINYARIKGTRTYMVNRVQDSTQMDWWKEFADKTRGSARPFWLRSYRADLKLFRPVDPGVGLLEIVGIDYPSKIFDRFMTHRYVRVANSNGEFVYRKIVDAYAHPDGTRSILTIDTPLPFDFTDVKVLEYILPCRIENDTIAWKHGNINSEVTINFITTNPEV